MQPLLDAPPPVHPYAKGSWGPAAADGAARRLRPLARAVGGVMTAVDATRTERPRPRAPPRRRRSRRSPSTRSCRTATRARWSRPTARSAGCASRASTRRACSARCSTARPASSGSARSASTSRRRAPYEPGTNTLVTTWQTPGGWVVVRDALTMGPRRGRTRSRRTRARRPTTTPSTCSCARSSASRARSRSSSSASRSSTTAASRAEWTLAGEDRHVADATGAGLTIRLQTDMALGVEGDRVRARHVAARGRAALLLAVVGGGPGRAGRRRRGRRARLDATTRFWRGWLSRARPIDHRWRQPIQRSALAIKGLTYMPTGATVAALDDVAARDAGRRAQLGLPLHVDARLDVHAAGAALARPRLGGRRVHAVRRRPRAQRGRLAADHVRHRRASRPDRDDARRPLRLRRRAPGAHRQRRVRPAPERRLRRGARLDPAAHAAQPAAAAAAVADRAGAGRVRDQRSGASPTRASGRPAARRSTTSPRSSCAGSRWTARRSSPRSAATASCRRPGARRPRRSRPTSSSTAIDRRRRAAPALRDRRAGRLHAAGGDLRLPARATTDACARASWPSPTT